MNTRGIAGYGLIGVGLLLAGVMLLPGRAITGPLDLERRPIPEEELKEIKKPRTKVAPVRISGSVTVPDGRKLKGVNIELYEVGRRGLVKKVATNRAGFYSIQLGGGWVEKTVSLIPQYERFRHGDHFSPQEENFEITSVNMTRNFQYNGPLPDLMVPQHEEGFGVIFSMGVGVRGSMCIFFILIRNGGEVESGPFKVKVAYFDFTEGYSGRLKYKIESVGSISAGGREILEVELGPGTEEDRGPGLESGTGKYRVISVRVDIEDSVIESNEDNNMIPW